MPMTKLVRANRRWRPGLLLVVASVVTALLVVVGGEVGPTAEAAPTRVEAESIAQPTSCWSLMSWSSLSGGRGRTCSAAAKPLAWTVKAPTGTSTVVRLYGYRDSGSRGFRVRIDGGLWTTGLLTGASSPSALFYSSPVLAPGTHRFELEWVSSRGGMTFDFYELDGALPPSTSSSSTATTSPVPKNVCPVAPADTVAAITAAIAACPNASTVQFPPGRVYHQQNAIDVVNRTDLVIDGGGSTFVSSAPNTVEVRPNWRIVWGRNVTLRHMTVVGNFRLAGPRSLARVNAIAPNQWNAGFLILGGDGVTVADVQARDIFGDFVHSAPANVNGGGSRYGEIPRNVRVVRLDGTRAARQCVAVVAAIGLSLEDSILRDCWYGAVDIEIHPNTRAHNVKVLRNTFDGFNLFAVTATHPGTTGDVDGVEIAGNRTLSAGDTCRPPILVGDHPFDPNLILRVVVRDNQLKTLGTGISLDHVNIGSVTGNRIEKTVGDTYCAPPIPLPVRVTSSIGVVQAANIAVGWG